MMRIRDAIHGDITLGGSQQIEERVVRTKEMQRLHWIRQLGSAFQVYPCAVHTRFNHSLGVFHVTKQILNILGDTTDEDEELIKIAALVHDIAHVPFGHTLETELELIGNHDGGERLAEFLDSGQIKGELGEMRHEVVKLLSKRQSDINMQPFHHEIIKDTICADLLDYIKRDLYFTGLKRDYDLRFLEYLTTAKLNDNSRHLVVRISEDGALCQDVLVELEHLLRVRYTLGERVYNYHTKIAGDAMIGKAMHEARVPETFLYDKGDEELVKYLGYGAHSSKIAKELGQAFAERKLLQRCYMLSHETFNDAGRNADSECEGTDSGERESSETSEWEDFLSKYRPSKQVRETCKGYETELMATCQRKGIALTHGQLIIFCHEPKMNLKAADLHVIEDSREPTPLSERIPADQIADDHRKLWRFYVFTDKKYADQVGKICEECFGYVNECRPKKMML